MKRAVSDKMLERLRHIANWSCGSFASGAWPGEPPNLTDTDIALHRRGLISLKVVAELTPEGESEVIKAQAGKPHLEPVE